MKIKAAIILIILAIISLSCSAAEEKKLYLTGKIDWDPDMTTQWVRGPVFVAIANTMDIEKIVNDPLNSIVTVKTVAANNRYTIDLTNTDAKLGDSIYIIAFADNDWNGSIPMLNAGDYLGIYVDKKKYAFSYSLTKYANLNLDIKLNRIYYNFKNAKINFRLDTLLSFYFLSGTWNYYDRIMLLALHKNGIKSDGSYALADDAIDYALGFTTMLAGNPGEQHSIDILPIVYDQIDVINQTITDVLLLAVQDKNLNGIPDTGDYIGYYYKIELNLPVPDLITITNGTTTLDMPVLFWGLHL